MEFTRPRRRWISTMEYPPESMSESRYVDLVTGCDVWLPIWTSSGDVQRLCFEPSFSANLYACLIFWLLLHSPWALHSNCQDELQTVLHHRHSQDLWKCRGRHRLPVCLHTASLAGRWHSRARQVPGYIPAWLQRTSWKWLIDRSSYGLWLWCQCEDLVSIAAEMVASLYFVGHSEEPPYPPSRRPLLCQCVQRVNVDWMGSTS